MLIAANSLSACRNTFSFPGYSFARVSGISLEGVIGYPKKASHPALIAA